MTVTETDVVATAKLLEWELPTLTAKKGETAEELESLLHSITSMTKDVRQKAMAILDSVRENRTSGTGISFLDVKSQVLLSYLQNITYYLMLKVNGNQVADHAVIGDLFFFRTLLEKIRPIDEKLRYRVDKLIAAHENRMMPALEELDEDEFKPSLDGLMTSITEGDDEDEAWPEAAADLDIEEKPVEDGEKLYKPPRISSVEYTGDHIAMAEKAQRQRDRQANRLRKTTMMEDMREEFSAMPTEIKGGLINDKRVNAINKKFAEREAYEEDTFTRLPVTKQLRKETSYLKHRKFQNHGGMSLHDMADVSDVFRDIGGGRSRGKRGGGSALSGLRAADEKLRAAQDVVRSAKEGKPLGIKKRRKM